MYDSIDIITSIFKITISILIDPSDGTCSGLNIILVTIDCRVLLRTFSRDSKQGNADVTWNAESNM